MENYTAHQARYFAEQINLKRSESTIESASGRRCSFCFEISTQ